jgi:H+/Cl- antiporter ClcA
VKTVTQIVFAILIGVFLLGLAVHEFMADEAIGYFSAQPSRLLWVAAIGIGGGLISHFYSRLPSSVQRKTKLAVVGSAAIFFTLFTIVFFYQIARLSFVLGVRPGWGIFQGVPFGTVLALGLWIEFYRTCKKRPHIA